MTPYYVFSSALQPLLSNSSTLSILLHFHFLRFFSSFPYILVDLSSNTLFPPFSARSWRLGLFLVFSLSLVRSKLHPSSQKGLCRFLFWTFFDQIPWTFCTRRVLVNRDINSPYYYCTVKMTWSLSEGSTMWTALQTSIPPPMKWDLIEDLQNFLLKKLYLSDTTHKYKWPCSNFATVQEVN